MKETRKTDEYDDRSEHSETEDPDPKPSKYLEMTADELRRTQAELEKENGCLRKELARLRNQSEKSLNELQEIENRLRLIVESSEDLIIMHDLEGRYLYCHVSGYYGVSADSLIGKTVFDLFEENEAATLMTQIRQVATSGISATFENRVRWRGETLWFSDQLSAVRNAEGKIIAVTKFCRNITVLKQTEAALQKSKDDLESRVMERTAELMNANIRLKSEIADRRRAEEALLEKENFIKSVLDSLRINIAVLDHEGTIIAVNRAWENFALENQGNILKTGLGTNYFDACQDALQSEESAEVEKILSGISRVMSRTLPEFETEYPCHSPEKERWFSLRVSPLEGKKRGAVVSHTDITARTNTLAELRESENRFATFMDHFPGAAFMRDGQGRFLYINRFMQETFDTETWTGKEIRDIFPGELSKQMIESDGNALKNGIQEVIGTVPDKKGPGRTYHVLKFPILRQGKKALVGGIAVDVTRELEAEKMLLKRTGDLAERVKELNCLYSMLKLVEEQNVSWNNIFQGIVCLIPPAMQYPQLACARLITYKGAEFRTENFRKTGQRLESLIFDNGKPVARLELCYMEENNRTPLFLPEEKHMFSAVGEHLGKVFERKRLYETLEFTNSQLLSEHSRRKELSKQLIDLLEKDRQHTAMELHDQIGQTLTSLKMCLEKALERSGNPIELKSEISSATSKAVQAIRELKQVSHGLRPVMLDTLGLIPALRNLFAEIREQSGVEISFFSVNIPERLGKDREIAVYRIIQESLNNALKYARTRKIFVNLIGKDRMLSVSIEDDGIGFDPEKIMKSRPMGKHLGLSIMRERAVQLGGEFGVESREGSGTHVLAEIPIESEN